MRIAITRSVSPSIVDCELTYRERQPIDVDLANQQHRHYEQCLVELGCMLDRLPAEPDLPDAVFVEDTAVVLEEVAILARPGAESRRPELPSVAERLKAYRRLLRIEPPGTMDGGDVLCVGKQIFVGSSRRTNAAGIAQLQSLVQDFGYRVQAADIRDCLHLKSAVTNVGSGTLLVDPTRVDLAVFDGFDCIETDPAEHHAANALLVGETVIYPLAHVRTRQRLEDHGITVRSVDISELAKAEAGVTCSSLVFES
jgi:dimethylargininase